MELRSHKRNQERAKLSPMVAIWLAETEVEPMDKREAEEFNRTEGEDKVLIRVAPTDRPNEVWLRKNKVFRQYIQYILFRGSGPLIWTFYPNEENTIQYGDFPQHQKQEALMQGCMQCEPPYLEQIRQRQEYLRQPLTPEFLEIQKNHQHISRILRERQRQAHEQKGKYNKPWTLTPVDRHFLFNNHEAGASNLNEVSIICKTTIMSNSGQPGKVIKIQNRSVRKEPAIRKVLRLPLKSKVCRKGLFCLD